MGSDVEKAVPERDLRREGWPIKCLKVMELGGNSGFGMELGTIPVAGAAAVDSGIEGTFDAGMRLLVPPLQGGRVWLGRIPRIALRSIRGYFRRVPPGRETGFHCVGWEAGFDRLGMEDEPAQRTDFVQRFPCSCGLRLPCSCWAGTVGETTGSRTILLCKPRTKTLLHSSVPEGARRRNFGH